MNDMTLIEAVTLEVGAAIAKSILKLWIKDSTIGNDISSSLIDLLKSRTADLVSQHKGQRQFDAIGEKVAESLLPLFEVEGSRLNEGSRVAIARAVAETFNKSKLTSELLAEHNLEPAKLAKYILTNNPTAIQYFDEAESSFYDRIIKETCTYIVSVASKLPDFNEFTFAEILKREDQLRDRTNLILQEIHRVREQLNPLANAERFEIDYRLATIRKLDAIELFGTDISSANRRHRLSVAYITLSVEQSFFSKRSINYKNAENTSSRITANSRTSQDEIERNTVSVDEILSRSQRLLIRGLAGSGKTTLLQWIAVRAASRTFEGQLSSWNQTIPFYIRLRHCTQTGLPRPSAFPSLVAPAIVDTMPQGWVNAMLASGRAIVLVDGLDEVPTIQREEVHAWLKELVESYPKSRYIITSRPHAVSEDWISHEKFIIAELQPMEMLDIYSFIDHWHAAIKEELQDDEDKDELKLSAESLKENVRRHRPIRNLATTPLLCAMLCALNRDRRQQLPADRIELYEACCSLLLERRDKERRIDLTDYPALSYRQKRLLLEDLAYWMIKNNWSEAVLQNICERFERTIKNMPGVYQDVSGLDVYRLFVERAGIIREPVVGRVDFTHRTFEEFLAANAASDEMDSGVLVTNAHNDQWREVIILASGLSTRQMRETLIRGLIERGDNEKELRYQFYLLAVACLETSIEIGQEVKVEVEKRLSQLIPPRSMSDAKDLAFAGELAVKYLANHRYPALTTAACVRTLGLIGSDAALEMLEAYAKDSRTVVVKQLIKAWDSFNRETYARNVLSITLRDKSELRLEYPPSLEGIQYFSNLKSLTLFCDDNIRDFMPLGSLQELVSLTLEGSVYIDNFTPLSGLPHLTYLTMKCYFHKTNFKTLADLPRLTKLTLHYDHFEPLQLKDLMQLIELNLLKYSPDSIYLVSLTKLTILDLSNSSKLRKLVLEDLPQLDILNLSHCSQLSDLQPLETLTKLNILNLSNCPFIEDLSPLAGLTQLKELDLSFGQFGTLFDYSQVHDLTPLAALKQLTSLNLAGCEQVNDLSPLVGLKQLTSLNLSNCPSITDLSVLGKLDSLKELVVSRIMANGIKIPPSREVKVTVV